MKRNLNIPDNGFGIDIDAFGHLLGVFSNSAFVSDWSKRSANSAIFKSPI